MILETLFVLRCLGMFPLTFAWVAHVEIPSARVTWSGQRKKSVRIGELGYKGGKVKKKFLLNGVGCPLHSNPVMSVE